LRTDNTCVWERPGVEFIEAGPALKIGLRIMRAILALGIALLFCNSSARAQSANELLQACETLERTMTISGGNVSFAQTQPNYECWYFMGAVQ
jgi:hypothetical protein